MRKKIENANFLHSSPSVDCLTFCLFIANIPCLQYKHKGEEEHLSISRFLLSVQLILNLPSESLHCIWYGKPNSSDIPGSTTSPSSVIATTCQGVAAGLLLPALLLPQYQEMLKLRWGTDHAPEFLTKKCLPLLFFITLHLNHIVSLIGYCDTNRQKSFCSYILIYWYILIWICIIPVYHLWFASECAFT